MKPDRTSLKWRASKYILAISLLLSATIVALFCPIGPFSNHNASRTMFASSLLVGLVAFILLVIPRAAAVRARILMLALLGTMCIIPPMGTLVAIAIYYLIRGILFANHTRHDATSRDQDSATNSTTAGS